MGALSLCLHFEELTLLFSLTKEDAKLGIMKEGVKRDFSRSSII